MSTTTRIEAIEKRLAAAKEKAAELAKQKNALLAKVRAREAGEKRKAENRRKFELGGLVQLAGLTDADKGALLGGLLGLAKAMQDPEKAAEWKRRGDALLAEREADRKVAK